MSKYNNVKTNVGGLKFDSKKEAMRYLELKQMEKTGHISDLELQVVYPLIINGMIICKYIADFRYCINPSINYTVEDVKGVKTPIYRLKKKLMKAIYKIDILET